MACWFAVVFRHYAIIKHAAVWRFRGHKFNSIRFVHLLVMLPILSLAISVRGFAFPLDVGHRAFDRRSSLSTKDGNGVTQRFGMPKSNGNVTALFPRSFESADNRKAAHAVAIATKHQKPFPLFNPVKRRIAMRAWLQNQRGRLLAVGFHAGVYASNGNYSQAIFGRRRILRRGDRQIPTIQKVAPIKGGIINNPKRPSAVRIVPNKLGERGCVQWPGVWRGGPLG